MAGEEGLTTEAFIDKVTWRLGRYVAKYEEEEIGISDAMKRSALQPSRKHRRNYDVDKDALRQIFDKYDTDGNGKIDVNELEEMLVAMGLAPMTRPKQAWLCIERQSEGLSPRFYEWGRHQSHVVYGDLCGNRSSPTTARINHISEAAAFARLKATGLDKNVHNLAYVLHFCIQG